MTSALTSALSKLSEERIKKSSYMLIDSTGPLVLASWLSEIIYSDATVKAEVSLRACMFRNTY